MLPVPEWHRLFMLRAILTNRPGHTYQPKHLKMLALWHCRQYEMPRYSAPDHALTQLSSLPPCSHLGNQVQLQLQGFCHSVAWKQLSAPKQLALAAVQAVQERLAGFALLPVCRACKKRGICPQSWAEKLTMSRARTGLARRGSGSECVGAHSWLMSEQMTQFSQRSDIRVMT